MTLENLGWFLFGAGCVIIGVVLAIAATTLIDAVRNKRKFNTYVNNLKSFGETLEKMNEASSKETSELTFRDISGKLCTVKIVIDYDLDKNLSEADRDKLRDMVLRGDANSGRVDDIIANAKYKEGELDKADQFIFSGHAVNAMRQQGIEPDEVVRRMLKASGRIA